MSWLAAAVEHQVALVAQAGELDAGDERGAVGGQGVGEPDPFAGIDRAGQAAHLVDVAGFTWPHAGLGGFDDRDVVPAGAQDDRQCGGHDRLADSGVGAGDEADGHGQVPGTTRRSTLTARASSSLVWCAWAVSRSREMPSGVEGGRKQPIRRPCPAAVATAASASRGPGIGTDKTAPAGSSSPQAPARVAALARTRFGQLRGGLDDPQGGKSAAGRGRGQTGVVDERPGPVDQVLPHRGHAQHQAALGTERLGQRPGPDHVGPAGQAVCGQQPATAGSGHAEPVRLVGDQHRVVLCGQRGQRGTTGAASPRTE